MNRFSRFLLVPLLAGALLVLLAPSDLLSCHGALSLRFLPIAEARIQMVKVQAELAKQRALLPQFAQQSPELTPWIKYYANPIFQPGPAGSWEEFSADCFTVGFYRNQYWLWYVGTPRSLNCQIGLAMSPDGVTWTRHPANPVLRIGPAGSWDSSILICQHILFDESEGVFKMWYVGGSAQGIFGIGYATSPDGVQWTKYAANPILTTTEPWEGTLIEGQTLLKREGLYHMWYGGLAVGSDVSYIGYATSTDGVHWTKYAGNPVISPAVGEPRPWDGYSVDTPDVYHDGTVYHMYYRGWRKRSGTSWIGHATSADGIHWTRDPANPILLTASVGGVWDNYQIYRSRVMPGVNPPDPHRFVVDKMWFTGRDYTLKSQVGLAFRVRRADVTDIPPPVFPQGVNQDRLELVTAEAGPGRVKLHYFTPWLSELRLTVYDKAGRKVAILVREPKLPGPYELVWDGTNDRGRKVPPGLYFAELATDDYLVTKEIVIAR
jgi:hypothetical protein